MTHPESLGESAALSWRTVWNEVLRHKRRLAVANLAAIVAVMAAVPVPLVLPILVDEVLLDKPGRFVAAVAPLFPPAWHGPLLFIGSALLLTVVLRVVAILLNVWQTRSFALVAKEVVFIIRRRLLERLSRIALSQYETLGTGKMTSHFVTDLNAIDSFLGASISGFLVAVLSLVGVAAVLFWMNWQLALFILLLNPVVIGFSTRLGKKVKEWKRRENSAFELFQEALTETLDALAQIRAMNRERHYLARVIDKAGDIRKHAAAYAWKSDALGRISFFIFLVGFDVFRAVSMLMVIYSGLSIGEMLAVFGYLWFMMSPVQEIINIQYAWFAANAAIARVNGLLALAEAEQGGGGRNPFAGAETVGLELRHLSFAYGDGDVVLDDVSLTVAPGEKVALVGASGGGKSTLVQALLGLYPASSGSILYGDVPVAEIGWATVRDHVGVVLQHPVLFNASVRDNLAMGREYADERLWHALAIAQLVELVESLPGGLEAVVGRHGVRLSGGQRQRLAIARMVLAEPEVVILDEATSALDTETERALHQALAAFLSGRTTLIIAHRLSAVKQADRILVFENGRVVEEGEHAALMEKGGLYHKLYAHA
ncbi:ABC transporter ATP-binding protein [Parasulfuritortus cantonensis]|uniref:ABC transporter ATP-binding protein n=1 Tax=Parasulfuritortus cantonensis TaxID=2528202 RepID=A0A4R1B3R4_9PROT|nr:ABC transporter ATP-binding protein [Parasulfuritortus cantonensis]TCJ12724.1 ABC transporter ATP-binding protein [Parasulfuritortus cantonensis]